MGESYRGLTIKIGADTTSLTRALKSANASIRQTQSELRKINQGLKFDSESAKLIALKVGELGQKAQQANAKLALLRKTLKSLEGTSVEKLAKQSKNLALDAENARAKYARVDEELARVYNSLAKIAEKNNVAFDRKKPDEMVAELRKLGKIDDELYAKIQRLKQAHHEAFASNEIHKQALQYKDLTVEIQRTEAEVRSLNEQQSRLKADAWTKQSAAVRQLKSELRGLEEQGEAVNREFRALSAAAKLNPTSVQALVAAYKGLEERIEIASKKQSALNAAMASLNASGIRESSESTAVLAKKVESARVSARNLATEIGEVSGKLQLARQEAAEFEAAAGKSSTAYKEQAAQVKALEESLERLTKQQREADQQLGAAKGQQQYRELANQARAAANEIERLKQQQSGLVATSGTSESALKSLGMTAYATVSPAFMMLGYKSVEAADRIDSSFRDMKKTVNGTEQDFENLREAALEFSRTHAVSADTILEIEAMGGQLGIAVDKLQDFGTVVSNLDIATNMNADEIAEDLGQLNNILPDLNDNYSAFGDALVRLGNNMPAQESAIMDVTSRIGSLGGIVGMSTPQVLAWATAIAATGQNSEAAGTAISNTMSDIEGAVASGGDSLEAFAKVANMSAEDFAKSWNETPSAAMQAFVQGLKSIDDQGGSVDATLQELGITGVRQKQALEGLAQTTDVLNDALAMSEDAWNGVSDEWGDAGDAAREASQKSEGFSGTLQMLKNSASEFGYELGNAMVPFMQTATEALQALTDGFKELPDPIKNMIIQIGLLGAASGSLMTMYSSLKGVTGDFEKNLIKNIAAAQANGSAYRIMGVDLAASATRMQNAGKSAEAVTKSMKRMATALNVVKVAAGAIAIVGLEVLIDQASKVYTNMKNAEKATTGLSDAASRLSSLKDYSGSIEAVGDQAGFAALSIDELNAKLAEQADSMNESASTAETQVGKLNGAMSTIQQYAGQTDLTTQQQGKLEAALKLVNDELGTTISSSDVATGKWTDQSGAVKNLTSDLEELIKQKEKQIKLDALQAQASTAWDNYSAACETAAKAQSDYNSACDEYIKWATESQHMTREQAQANIDNGTAVVKERQELEKANESMSAAEGAYNSLTDAIGDTTRANSESADAYDKWGNSLSQYTNSLLNAATNSSNGLGMLKEDLRNLGASTEDLSKLTDEQMQSIASAYDGTAASVVGKLRELGVGMDDAKAKAAEAAVGIKSSLEGMDLGDTFSDLGVDIDAFSQKLAEAGVSTEDLNKVGSENLSAIASNCEGNTQKMVAAIQLYNSQPLVDKDGNVNINDAKLTDAQGNLYTWNGSELVDKNGNAAIDDTSVLDAQGNLWTWNGSTLEFKSGTGQVIDRITPGQTKLNNWNSSQLLSKSGTGEVKDNMSSALNTANAWNKMSLKDKFATGTIDIVQRVTQFFTGNAKGGIRPHADGGIVPRYHANGAIATRAVPLDIVGEDGAEAIVPLTNKKYSLPFAKVLAQQINELSPVSDQVSALTSLVSTGFETGAEVSMRAAMLASSEAAQSAAGTAADVLGMDTRRYDMASEWALSGNGSAEVIQWLEKNLGPIISDNSPDLVIDNDAGQLIVDNRLYQLQRKAAMNRG